MPGNGASPTPPLALVTGGHRRLGARIAAALAEAGYALAIHGSHDAAPDAALLQSLNGAGLPWHGFVADFADPAAAESLLTAVVGHFGRAPDLIVNSASMFGQDRIDTVAPEDLAAHFAVNASAPALLTKAFANATRDDPTGRERSIVNILDQRLSHPHGDQLAYTLSKFALAGLTRASAQALAPRIRVNAVAPGLTIVTPDYGAEQTRRLGEMMPLGRLPLPEEVSEAVLYLARARATTGQILHVDGGAHMVAYERDFVNLLRN
ncbi:MAG TPA: SDR family oxidoreductase [Sphingobium sp.]|nr:SDR family oxidoreductase [Sphingobium sp.]